FGRVDFPLPESINAEGSLRYFSQPFLQHFVSGLSGYSFFSPVSSPSPGLRASASRLSPQANPSNPFKSSHMENPSPVAYA
ncbi:hypothetical protein, partial [Alistipes putredinis]|uniref:hypothetical protein n=1 Tax=Alistipes putredinis TaxID=28117 RepID=UPI003AB00871